MVHKKVARVKVPHEPLSLALYYFKDKMVINDKYGQQEEYCGFTQDFEEKDGYKLHVKFKFVDEMNQKLTSKVF